MNFGKFLAALLLTPFRRSILKRKRTITKIYVVLLVLLLTNLVFSCYYYKVAADYAPTEEKLNQFSDLGKNFVVHQQYEAYYVLSLAIVSDSLQMKLGTSYYQPGMDMVPSTPKTVKRYRPKKGDARLLNEVHLFVGDQVIKDGKSWTVPISGVERLDVYNHSTGHTVGYSILFGLALVPVAWVAITLLWLLVMALSGNSCPFIYTFNGEAYVFAGEIYSGAIYPPLERDDYLLLSDLSEKEGLYSLKISNQLEEVQHTNLMELMIFDHPENVQVLVDKYGNPHQISEMLPPVSATNPEGTNLLPLLEREDDLIYVGRDPSRDPPLLDGAILTFDQPDASGKVSLLIEAKNSYWLDFVYHNFREMLGSSFDLWTRKQQKGNPEQMENWSLSQHIPLSVYIWKNDEWVFHDYYNTVGPMAFKKDVLELDLNGTGQGPLMIKLETGSYFWELGFAALTIETDAADPCVISRILEARDEQNTDVRELLMENDDQYYVQPEIGNEAIVAFQVPETGDESRTIILHSSGYYDILQEPSGLPKIKALKEIRKSGNFNRYSNELMQAMMEEYVISNGKKPE